QPSVVELGQWFVSPNVSIAVNKPNITFFVLAKDDFGRIMNYELQFNDENYHAPVYIGESQYVIEKGLCLQLNLSDYFEAYTDNPLFFSVKVEDIGMATVESSQGAFDITATGQSGVTKLYLKALDGEHETTVSVDLYVVDAIEDVTVTSAVYSYEFDLAPHTVGINGTLQIQTSPVLFEQHDPS